MIKLNQIAFGYGTTPILKNISFEIKKGEFVAIIGENGAGKSTLSKMFNGLLKPDKGNVLIKGMDTRTTKTSELAKHIGFLFQNPDRQLCQNTIKEEIAFGLKMRGESEDLIKERVTEMLERFGFQGDMAPFMLSRGEKQRLALASLIALKPEILQIGRAHV